VSLRPVVIEEFPGLDLRTDPGDSRGAIDAQNVTLERGRVRTRDGGALFFTLPVAEAPVFMKLFNRPSAPHLIVISSSSPNTAYAITTAGVTVASVALGGSNDTYSGVAIGTPTASFFYVKAAAGATRRWDGAAWGAPAGFDATARLIGLSPTDNRLVQFLPASGGCKASFSDPGAPETFGANNYVLLTPGDGEEIQAAEVFNNQLFVFKQTKFFVFYGNSTDSAGNPIFNYRVVDTGVGVTQSGAKAAASSVCASPSGIYFLANDGIYRTTGGPPVKVSGALDPWFGGYTLPFFATAPWLGPQSRDGRVEWLDGKVYVSLTPTSNVGIVFVLDEATGAWTLWQFGALVQAMTSLPYLTTGAEPRRLLFGFQNARTLLLMTPGQTTDNGTAITSRYRLPFETYGTPGEKRIRETIVEGTGTPTVQWSDDWGALTTGSTVTLGTSPNVAVGRQRLAQRGRAFSLQLGAASGAWAVNRVQVNVGEGIRGPEVTV
jgi:hypothetical protein